MSLAVSITGNATNPSLTPAPTSGVLEHLLGQFDFTNDSSTSIDYKVGTGGGWSSVPQNGTFTITTSSEQLVEIGTAPTTSVGPVGNVTVTLKKSRGV